MTRALKQSHPSGNYDNRHRSQPITSRLSRLPYAFVAILEIHPQSVCWVSPRLKSTAAPFTRSPGSGMNGSRNKPAPTVSKGQTDSDSVPETNHRDRKSGGGMLKKLKSRRSQTEKWPAVTEAELRALGKDISPDHVLGLRAVTEGTGSKKFILF